MSEQITEGLKNVREAALAPSDPVEPPGGGRSTTAGSSIMQRLQLGRFSGVYLWIATIVFFAVTIPDTFLTSTTAKGILGDQAITAMVSLGVLVALNAGMFDLSIGQNLGFSAILVGSLTVK